MSLAKVTCKGQITIPKRIREALGIEDGDSVSFFVDDDDKVIIRRVKHRDLMDFRGVFPATRPYPGMDAIREEVGKAVAEDVLDKRHKL